MTTWRPASLPQLRDQLLHVFRNTSTGRRFQSALWEELRDQRHAMPDGRINDLWGQLPRRFLVEWLDLAAMYLVTAPMCQLVRQAGEQLREIDIPYDAMPSTHGLLVYAETLPVDMTPSEISPLGVIRDLTPGQVFEGQTRGFLWGPAMTRLGPSTMIMPFSDMEMIRRVPWITERNEFWRSIANWPAAWADPAPYVHGTRYPLTGDLRHVPGRWYATTVHLLGQRITVTEQAQMPRSVVKQFERTHRPQPDVRTVTLRRAKAPTTHGHPGTGRRYDQWQWPVEGHWHTYWTGHGRSVRRSVWVDDYWKGDPNAPVLGGERVNVLRR
jgi:hypothetical protein